MCMPQILFVLAAVPEIGIYTEWGNTGHSAKTTEMKSMATCWKTLNSCQATFPKIFCPIPHSSFNYQLLSPAGASCSKHQRHILKTQPSCNSAKRCRDGWLALLIFHQTEEHIFHNRDSLQPTPEACQYWLRSALHCMLQTLHLIPCLNPALFGTVTRWGFFANSVLLAALTQDLFLSYQGTLWLFPVYIFSYYVKIKARQQTQG